MLIKTKEELEKFYHTLHKKSQSKIKSEFVKKFKELYGIGDELDIQFKQFKYFDFSSEYIDSLFIEETSKEETFFKEDIFKEELKKLKYSSSKLHEHKSILSNNKYFTVFLKYGIESHQLYTEGNFEVEDYYEPLGSCCVCGRKLKRRELFDKFKTRHINYRKTCSNGCENRLHSQNIKGGKNPNITMSEETRKLKNKKQSTAMKQKILDGEFTPPVTNSWSKSRVYISGIPFRSSWEALFFILHPTSKFESVRIPYEYGGKKRIYIVDFELDGILYEIKPKSEIQTEINEKKFLAANNSIFHKFEIITEEYFKSHISKIKANYDKISNSIDVESRRKIERTINQFTN